MNYKKLIKNSFSQVVPETDNESFMKSVMEREKIMEYSKKKHIKKPRVIIAIAAAAMLSVTAVATTLNFDEIFGNRYFKAENAETANELIANVTNIETCCDNEDYTVNLKGVTGSEDSFVAVVEIARKDGQPVREYWQNAVLFRAEEPTDSLPWRNSRYRGVTREDGVFEIVMDCSAFNFLQMSHYCEDTMLYENKDGVELISLSDAQIKLSSDHRFLLYTGEERPARLDETTDLQWSVSFTYEPSESTKVLTCEDLSEKVTLYRGIDIFNDNEVQMKIKSIRAGGNRLTMEYEINAIYNLHTFYYNTKDNSFALVKKDETEILLQSIGESMTDDNRMMMFAYVEDRYSETELVIDLDQIEALRINDKIYKLS